MEHRSNFGSDAHRTGFHPTDRRRMRQLTHPKRFASAGSPARPGQPIGTDARFLIAMREDRNPGNCIRRPHRCGKRENRANIRPCFGIRTGPRVGARPDALNRSCEQWPDERRLVQDRLAARRGGPHSIQPGASAPNSRDHGPRSPRKALTVTRNLNPSLNTPHHLDGYRNVKTMTIRAGEET
jgi:hypothetical protein